MRREIIEGSIFNNRGGLVGFTRYVYDLFSYVFRHSCYVPDVDHIC